MSGEMQELISDQGLRYECNCKAEERHFHEIRVFATWFYRLDGRRANELRRIQYKLGVFTQPDGSAYFEQGNTKVLVAVYGPHKVIKSSSGVQLKTNLLMHSLLAPILSHTNRRNRVTNLCWIANTVWPHFRPARGRTDREAIANQKRWLFTWSNHCRQLLWSNYMKNLKSMCT